jgi:hypothetical protein
MLGQETLKFKANLAYIARPHLKKTKNKQKNRTRVVYTCNPSYYLGGRDQECCSLKSEASPANSSQDPISKIPNTRKGRRLVQEHLPTNMRPCVQISVLPEKKKKQERLKKSPKDSSSYQS